MAWKNCWKRVTLHWVSTAHALKAEVRLYDRLFAKEDPNDVPEGQDFIASLNPNSLEVRRECYVEPSLIGATPGDCVQFERLGYFCVDSDSVEAPADGGLVFNRTVALRDTWARVQEAQQQR